MSSILDKAKMFAVEKHGTQRYGILPYTHHLEDVERALRTYGATDDNDSDILQAAWLHDVVEDTDAKIRDIVAAVTSEPGENRKVRNALTYPKIRAAGAVAVRLKLADRIANMSRGGGSRGMYQREHDEFRYQLFRDGENLDMWAALNGIVGAK